MNRECHHRILLANSGRPQIAICRLDADKAFVTTGVELDTDHPTEAPSQSLMEAAEKLGLQIDANQSARLEEYCARLWEWNTKVNLTRHTDFDLFARRDLLDSMRLAAQLQPEEDILDVGTGGGVPGLVLAILRPDLNVSVCDSVEKKAKVVQDITESMQLPVPVHAARAQDVLEDLRFHSLVSRAVGSLAKLLGWLADYWVSFDRLLVIKGPRWTEERGQARHLGLMANLDLRKLDSYQMPGTENESVILQVKHKSRLESTDGSLL